MREHTSWRRSSEGSVESSQLFRSFLYRGRIAPLYQLLTIDDDVVVVVDDDDDDTQVMKLYGGGTENKVYMLSEKLLNAQKAREILEMVGMSYF